MDVVIHYDLLAGKLETDVKHIDVTLFNGVVFTIKERVDSPGTLDVTADGTLLIIPRSTNAIRIREER